MKWQKWKNFRRNDLVILDERHVVKVVDQTPLKMLTIVTDEDGERWPVMTCRLVKAPLLRVYKMLLRQTYAHRSSGELTAHLVARKILVSLLAKRKSHI